MRPDVLIVVEDPGAANFVADLPAALAAIGLRSSLCAAGVAAPYLRQQGIVTRAVPDQNPAGLLAPPPRLLVVGTSENPDGVGLPLLKSASEAGVPTVAVIDAPTCIPYRFRGRAETPLAYRPDVVAVPDERCVRPLTDLGFDPAAVVVTGHPHYDRVRRGAAALESDIDALRARLLPGWTPDRRIVVFLSEINDGLIPLQCVKGDDYTLAGDGVEEKRTNIVIQEILMAFKNIRKDVYFVLRLHPKQTHDDLDVFEGAFDLISSGGASLPFVVAAHGVIGMTSMALAEAMLARRPALSIVPRLLERAWLPALIADRIQVATTRAEVKVACAELMSGRWTVPSSEDLAPPGAAGRLAALAAALIDRAEEGHGG